MKVRSTDSLENDLKECLTNFIQVKPYSSCVNKNN